MTRATPKARRWFAVEDADGTLRTTHDSRKGAEFFVVYPGDRIVECMPVPRVTVRKIEYPLSEVLVNGARVYVAGTAIADGIARDLRRALRGK